MSRFSHLNPVTVRSMGTRWVIWILLLVMLTLILATTPPDSASARAVGAGRLDENTPLSHIFTIPPGGSGSARADWRGFDRGILQFVEMSKGREYALPLCPGTNIHYTVTLRNTSPSPVPQVSSIMDPIPANTTYVMGSVVGGNYIAAANRIEWFGPLAGGQSHTVSFSVTVNAGVPDGTEITNKALEDFKKKIGEGVRKAAKQAAKKNNIPLPSDLVASAFEALIDLLTESGDDALGRFSGKIQIPDPCEDSFERSFTLPLENLVSDELWAEAEEEPSGREFKGDYGIENPAQIGSLKLKLLGGRVVNKFSAKATQEDPPSYTELTLIDLGQPDETVLSGVMALAASLPAEPLSVRYRFLLDPDNNLTTGAQEAPMIGADFEMRLEFQNAETLMAQLLAYDTVTRAFQEIPGGLYDWAIGIDRAHIYLAVESATLGDPSGPVAGWGIVETDEGVASIVPAQPEAVAPMIPLNAQYTGVPPSVISTIPLHDAIDVDRATNICVTFDKAMDRPQTQAAFSVTPAVDGTFAWQGNTLCLHPTSPLSPFTKYTVTVDASAIDRVGTPLDGDGDLVPGGPFTWSFWTKGRPLFASDATGNPKGLFTVGQPIYVTGESFPANMTLEVYMISHPPLRLSDDIPLSDVSGDGVTVVSTDSNGRIATTLLSRQAPSVGEFNIVVDVNDNGQLDLAQDRIDRLGIGFAVRRMNLYLPLILKNH